MWKKIRYQLEYGGLLITARLIPLLPRWFVLAMAHVGGGIASMADRAGRRVALANLNAVFGKEYCASEKRRIVRKSYQHFAQTMLDLMWSPRLNSDNFHRYIDFEWPRELRPGENVIIACYHYSNFEWLSLACGFRNLRGTILAQEFKNSVLEPIFRCLREQSGHFFIPRTGGILRVFKLLRRGGNTAMLIDLTVRPGTSAVAINCLGLQKSVTPAHAWLHQRTAAALIPAHCQPLKRGRYRVVFHPRIELGPNAGMPEIAQACWDTFEPVVRANPAPWLWMYKHWRYRPMHTDRSYPFYSNPDAKFERMLAKK
jgi:Kdo2-lipid IVA lauroyltransferase/acyltransferase